MVVTTVPDANARTIPIVGGGSWVEGVVAQEGARQSPRVVVSAEELEGEVHQPRVVAVVLESREPHLLRCFERFWQNKTKSAHARDDRRKNPPLNPQPEDRNRFYLYINIELFLVELNGAGVREDRGFPILRRRNFKSPQIRAAKVGGVFLFLGGGGRERAGSHFISMWTVTELAVINLTYRLLECRTGNHQ